MKLDSIVITPDGYKQVGELKNGDLVMGRYSHFYKILDFKNKRTSNVYDVFLSDNTRIEVDKHQLFKVSIFDKENEFKEIQKIDLDLFLDSGAFSALTQNIDIDIDKYCNFIKTNENYFNVYAGLDVIDYVRRKPNVLALGMNTHKLTLTVYYI